MMQINKIATIVVILILLTVIGYWITLPKSYEDCILKYMGDAKIIVVAREIDEACRKKFPIKKKG